MSNLRKATHSDFFKEDLMKTHNDNENKKNNRMDKVKQKEYGEKKFIKP